MRNFVHDSQLAAVNFGGWLVMLALHLRPVQSHDLTCFAWGSVTVISLALLRYALDFRRGILIDLILMGSRLWQNGAFNLPRI